MPHAASIPNARPPEHDRKFVSQLVESCIDRTLPKIKDLDLKQLFKNCWPNTLDTTVFKYDLDLGEKDHAKARPEAWIITGDINAMWLRDSTAQIAPYLSLLTSTSSTPEWIELYRLVLGVLYAQAQCILHHPFSNAFVPPGSTELPDNDDWVNPPPESQPDSGESSSGTTSPRKSKPPPRESGIQVWESKYELDSLASFLDLAGKIATVTGRKDFADNPTWTSAVELVLEVLSLQQKGTEEEVKLLGTPWHGPGESGADGSEDEDDVKGKKKDTLLDDDDEGELVGRYSGAKGVYGFQRETRIASETRALAGLGEPARRTGLIKSAFRPSDDATLFPFLIPSNCYLSSTLLTLASILHPVKMKLKLWGGVTPAQVLAGRMERLGTEVREAIMKCGVVRVWNEDKGTIEKVFAFEVDGFGSQTICDDSNVPSLLSLPYFNFIPSSDPIYEATRRLVLSPRNKWYFSGRAGQGIGGMHVGEKFIWPMAIIMRAMTSSEDEEILDCLSTLKSCTAGTGFMHESFHCDNAENYTRSWFAWANGLFGQLILHLAETKPYLL